MYNGYSAVSDSGSHNFLRLRETVLARKEARKMFVQANTRLSGMYLDLYLLNSFTGYRLIDCLCDSFNLMSDYVLFPGDNVELVEYEGSAAGLIRSFTERFEEDAEKLEADLLEMGKRDAPCWC